MKPFRKVLQAFFRWLTNTVLANSTLRDLVYNAQNVDEFTSLLEHEKMLADESRVSSYFRAIQRNIQPDQVVLDLGTGSGILTFFAAQQKPRTIYAIDHSEFIEVARQIAEHHHIQNVVFVRQNSRYFTPPEPLDIIIHEQMGDALFNENMVENLLDLKRRALKPGGKILPGKFNLYLEPACLRSEYKIPFFWENRWYGIDFSFLKNNNTLDAYKPRRYDKIFIEHHAVEFFLCQPTPILSFDLNELNNPNDLPTHLTASKSVVHAGEMDGLCLYFEAIFDEENILSTSPFEKRTSWTHLLIRTERKEYSPGEQISVELSMPNLLKFSTWTVTVHSSSNQTSKL